MLNAVWWHELTVAGLRQQRGRRSGRRTSYPDRGDWLLAGVTRPDPVDSIGRPRHARLT